MTEFLKPCPCCNSSAVFTPVQGKAVGEYDFERGRVECVKCDLRTGGTLARDAAVTGWNQRASANRQPQIDIAAVHALVTRAQDLVDKVTFDESGALIAGQWRGGNGGLINKETIQSADLLRRELSTIADAVAAYEAQQGKRQK